MGVPSEAPRGPVRCLLVITWVGHLSTLKGKWLTEKWGVFAHACELHVCMGACEVEEGGFGGSSPWSQWSVVVIETAVPTHPPSTKPS